MPKPKSLPPLPKTHEELVARIQVLEEQVLTRRKKKREAMAKYRDKLPRKSIRKRKKSQQQQEVQS